LTSAFVGISDLSWNSPITFVPLLPSVRVAPSILNVLNAFWNTLEPPPPNIPSSVAVSLSVQNCKAFLIFNSAFLLHA